MIGVNVGGIFPFDCSVVSWSFPKIITIIKCTMNELLRTNNTYAVLRELCS